MRCKKHRTCPKRNVIVADLCAATTLCAVNKNNDFLGGAILPGLKLGKDEAIFDLIIPNLVLQGLWRAYQFSLASS